MIVLELCRWNGDLDTMILERALARAFFLNI